jgi:hypothetical protein
MGAMKPHYAGRNCDLLIELTRAQHILKRDEKSHVLDQLLEFAGTVVAKNPSPPLSSSIDPNQLMQTPHFLSKHFVEIDETTDSKWQLYHQRILYRVKSVGIIHYLKSLIHFYTFNLSNCNIKIIDRQRIITLS